MLVVGVFVVVVFLPSCLSLAIIYSLRAKEKKCDPLIDCLFSFLFFQASFTIKT